MSSAGRFPPGFLDESRSATLMNLSIAFIVFETLFVSLFIASRIKSKTANGLDAYLIPLALPFCVTEAACLICLTIYAGEGRHVEALTPGELVNWYTFVFVSAFIYPFAVNLPRLGILCLYLRIFQDKNTYRYATYAVIGIIILNWIVIQCIELAQCIPIQTNWDKDIPGGHCIDVTRFEIWASFPNIVTDLAIFILPIPVVWNLQMSIKRKVGVTLTFATGALGVITAILRFWEFDSKSHISADLTWASVPGWQWTVVETGVYLIAACLPSLRSLFKQILKGINLRSIRSLFANNSRNDSAKSIQLHTIHPGNSKICNRSVGNAGFVSLDDRSLQFFIDVRDHKGLLASYRTASEATSKDGSSQTELKNIMPHAVIHVQRVHAPSTVAQRP